MYHGKRDDVSTVKLRLLYQKVSITIAKYCQVLMLTLCFYIDTQMTVYRGH